VILAEGLPCESYLETGNRGAFSNGGPPVQMHPDFALKTWDTKGFARLILQGPELEAARSFLLHRATQLGREFTREPDLRLIADGTEIRPEVLGRIARFHVPASSHCIRLMSRSAVPARLYDVSSDHRQLGVAVSGMVYGGVPVPLTHPSLGSGWHAVEHDTDQMLWRWTDGDASLSIAGGNVLDVDVVMTGRYWLERRSLEQESKAVA
jgi:hypothetical protein